MTGPIEAFLNILSAAMIDAAKENKMFQMKTQCDPCDGNGMRVVRIIVVPEAMEHNWPAHAPLGSETEGT